MSITIKLIHPVKAGYFFIDKKSWKKGRRFKVLVQFICTRDRKSCSMA